MNSAKRARLAEDEAGMVPPSPMRGSTVHDLRKSLFSTPFKKNAKKYEIGEQKQPLEVVLRVRSLPDDQDTIITHCANNQITVTSKRDVSSSTFFLKASTQLTNFKKKRIQVVIRTPRLVPSLLVISFTIHRKSRSTVEQPCLW